MATSKPATTQTTSRCFVRSPTSNISLASPRPAASAQSLCPGLRTLCTVSARSGPYLNTLEQPCVGPPCTRCTLSAPSPHPLRTLSTVRAPRSSCRSWAKSTKSSVAATPRRRRSRRPTAWRRRMSCPRGLPPPSPLPSSPLTLIFAVTVILALAFTLALIFTSTLNITLALTLTPHLAPTRCATCASSPRGSRSNWAPRARYTCSTVRTATRATTRCPPPSRETMPSPPARTRRRSSRQRPRRA